MIDREFWKYFWETNIIESDYFDNIYGKKEYFNIEEDIDNE